MSNLLTDFSENTKEMFKTILTMALPLLALAAAWGSLNSKVEAQGLTISEQAVEIKDLVSGLSDSKNHSNQTELLLAQNAKSIAVKASIQSVEAAYHRISEVQKEQREMQERQRAQELAQARSDQRMESVLEKLDDLVETTEKISDAILNGAMNTR